MMGIGSQLVVIIIPPQALSERPADTVTICDPSDDRRLGEAVLPFRVLKFTRALGRTRNPTDVEERAA